MRQTVCFILLNLMSPVLGIGQFVRGVVRDADLNPLPYAGIVVSSMDGENVLAFASSNESGVYELHVKTDLDSVLLTARALGFLPEKAVFHTDKQEIKCDFVLNPVLLNEVIIRSKAPPIVVQKDTTTFNAAAFSDSTEFSIEDLLKKLPGIQVDGNGMIYYNGKTVERVLLDGEDLFAYNYQIATRNIRADLISKIQAIDRYQENPLLDAFQTNSRTILNLTIKDDKKRNLSGSATMGAGYGKNGKFKGHLNLFSLSRKDKFYLIANGNNTGENTTPLDLLTGSDPFDQNQLSIQESALLKQSAVVAPAFKTLGLPRSLTTVNKSGFFYIGEVLPLTPQLKIKASTWFGRESLAQQSATFTEVKTIPTALFIQEKNRHVALPTVQNVQTEINYLATDRKTSIRSFIKLNADPNSDTLDIRRSQSEGKENKIKASEKNKTRESILNVEYTYKFNKNILFQIAGKYAQLNHKHTLDSRYAAYPAYILADSTLTNLKQKIAINQHKEQLFFRTYLNHKNLNIKLELGGENYTGTLGSAVAFLSETGSNFYADSTRFFNAVKQDIRRLFIQAGLVYKTGKWEYAFQGKLQALHAFAHQGKRFDKNELKQGIATPAGSIRFKPDDRNLLTVRYSLAQTIPELYKICQAYYFLNYQTIQKGVSNSLIIRPQHALNMYYGYLDRIQQSSWHASLGYQIAKQQFGGRYLVNPYITEINLYRPVRTDTWSGTLGGSKYLKTLGVRLEVEALIAHIKEAAQLNQNNIQYYISAIPSFRIQLGSAFNTWINGLVNVKYNLYITESQNIKTIQQNWTNQFQLKIRPDKRINFQIDFFQNALKPQEGVHFQFFTSANLGGAYYFRDGRNNLQLQINNLGNKRQFDQLTSSGFYLFRDNIQLIAPFFVISWDFKF